MRQRVDLTSIDVAHRDVHLSGEFENLLNSLFVDSMADEDHVKTTLPRLERGNDGLPAFEMLVSCALLFSLITSSLLLVHVSRAQDQRTVSELLNEKRDEVTSRVRLSKRSVNIFPSAIPVFDKTILGVIEEDFFNFVLRDLMLDCQLIDDVWQPDKIINVQ